MPVRVMLCRLNIYLQRGGRHNVPTTLLAVFGVLFLLPFLMFATQYSILIDHLYARFRTKRLVCSTWMLVLR